MKFRVLAGLAVLSCSLLFAACNQNQEAASGSTEQAAVVNTTVETAGDKNAQLKEQTASAPLYTDIPQSLSPVECASCHNGQYVRLQKSLSKHRFDCLDCHKELHANIPSKDNYSDILPKCASCHKMPHGEAFPNCSHCHQDPHAPLTIPFAGVKGNIKNHAGQNVVACEVCHYDSEGKEMEDFPSLHNTDTKAGCTGCHGDNTHGVRPTCFKCHKGHTVEQTYADCLVCHRPHSAMNILPYPVEISNTVCAACHTDIADNLQANHTKHTDLQCAACHATHGQIPQCQQCHKEPHGNAVHKRFPDCLECHVDPHDLPIKPGA